MDVLGLKEFLNCMMFGRKIHICIHDISGILNGDKLKIDFENMIHSKAFCSAAKSVKRGYDRCIRCKMVSNHIACTRRGLFVGECVNGLCEVVCPVVIEGDVICIVYVGNIVRDMEETSKRLEKSCRENGLPSAELFKYLGECERCAEVGEYVGIARAIESYITLLYNGGYIDKRDRSCHWAVNYVKQYANENFTSNVTLKEVCRLYFINEKYTGRLFNREMGKTFREYVNGLRLDRAESLLKNTEMKVINVALDSGFSDAAYFNRIFKKRHGITPTEFRRKLSDKV